MNNSNMESTGKKEPGPSTKQVEEGVKGLEEQIVLRVDRLPLYLRQRMRGDLIKVSKHWTLGLFDTAADLERAVV